MTRLVLAPIGDEGRHFGPALLGVADSLGEALAAVSAGADIIDLGDASETDVTAFLAASPGVPVCAADRRAAATRLAAAARASGALLICADLAAARASGRPADRVVVQTRPGGITAVRLAGYVAMVDADQAGADSAVRTPAPADRTPHAPAPADPADRTPHAPAPADPADRTPHAPAPADPADRTPHAPAPADPADRTPHAPAPADPADRTPHAPAPADPADRTPHAPAPPDLAGSVAAAALSSWLGAALIRTRYPLQVRRALDMTAVIQGLRPPARTVRGLA